MPAPLLAAGIVAGSQLLSSGINAASQIGQNRKNRAFAEHMYDRQRGDALTDRAFENEYSSPAAQMARLKSAGLNPNLVYGNGAAQQESAKTRPSNFSQPDTRAPQVDLDMSRAVGQYYDARLKDAQTDQTRELVKVAAETAALTAANTIKAGVETTKLAAETSRVNQMFSQSEQAFPLSQQAARLELDKINAELQKIAADTRYTIDQNKRAAAQNSMSLREAVARMLRMDVENARTQVEKRKLEAEISNLASDNQLKNLDILLKNNNIQPHDNAFMRTLQNWMNQLSKRITFSPVQ